ncbi:hypothetical protein T10_3465 [Trichinella papuae]|uniref:Uncharacterized protein n=1 Tax=Trichinella papuae TaxID=268474 RepID=A0A0V1M4W5_9BILA|nr:hypothetical protein T10_3465 [Trichinella papuae]
MPAHAGRFERQPQPPDNCSSVCNKSSVEGSLVFALAAVAGGCGLHPFSQRFHVVGMDILGPLEEARNGNQCKEEQQQHS